jgi:hypothetical protein
VIFPPPSMTVFLFVGTFKVAVTGIVTAPPPQLKVMTPPWVTAALSAANVQLDALPVPTTVVGFEVSAGWPFDGTPALHEPLGLPADPAAPASGVPPPRRHPSYTRARRGEGTSGPSEHACGTSKTVSTTVEDNDPRQLYPFWALSPSAMTGIEPRVTIRRCD